MDILLMVWFIIDMVFFIGLLFRKRIEENDHVMNRRSIESVKGLGSRLLDNISKTLVLIPIGVVIYCVIISFSNKLIQELLEWYKGIFIVTLFPLLLSWIKEKHLYIKSIWNVFLPVLAVVFSMVGYIIDTESINVISEFRVELNILMTMLVTFFLDALFEIGKKDKEYYSNKLPKKGIRKDLYYRTTGLMVNVSNTELIKSCEKYFGEYIHRYRKIKELQTIEYVYLPGAYRELWYKKAVSYVKGFVGISLFAITISIYRGLSNRSLWVIGFLIIFWILTVVCKHKDLRYLHIIGIRYFYDDWGYYLTYSDKNKFIGDVQLVESTKFHKYIHSFLDIVALCRAVSFNDKMNGEKKYVLLQAT